MPVAASPVLTKEGEDKVESVKRDEKFSVDKNEESTKVGEEEGKERESEVGETARVESPAEIEENQKVEEREKAEEEKVEEEKVEGVKVEEEKVEEMKVEEEKGSTGQEQEPAASSEPEKNYTIDEEEDVADTEKADAEKVVDGNDKDWEEVQAEDVNGEKDVISEAKLEPKNMASEARNEAFVGDTTWEERTWKELVRLREEMFWARVGASRQ